jgi:hypothetical protein
LSANSEISVAAIQKIEAGSANPSLLSVIAIIEALGEPVDQVISASRETRIPVKVVRGEFPARANGVVDLTPALADRRMHCSLHTLGARQKIDGEEVSRDAPVFGYVLDGELRLSFRDGRVEHLAVGDSFHAAANNSAEWRNPLARKSLVLCIADRAEK